MSLLVNLEHAAILPHIILFTPFGETPENHDEACGHYSLESHNIIL